MIEKAYSIFMIYKKRRRREITRITVVYDDVHRTEKSDVFCVFCCCVFFIITQQPSSRVRQLTPKTVVHLKMIGMMVKVKEVKTRSELEKIITEQEIQIAEQEKNIEFLEMENERVKKALTDALVRYYILFCGFVTF
jgi:hypothetical protein